MFSVSTVIQLLKYIEAPSTDFTPGRINHLGMAPHPTHRGFSRGGHQVGTFACIAPFPRQLGPGTAFCDTKIFAAVFLVDSWCLSLLKVASSDATNIQSKIDLDGDSYVINGRKWWTSGMHGYTLKFNSPRSVHDFLILPWLASDDVTRQGGDVSLVKPH